MKQNSSYRSLQSAVVLTAHILSRIGFDMLYIALKSIAPHRNFPGDPSSLNSVHTIFFFRNLFSKTAPFKELHTVSAAMLWNRVETERRQAHLRS